MAAEALHKSHERNPRVICPAPNCMAYARRGYLMCDTHWQRVPSDLQRTVWDAWDQFNVVALVRATSSDPSLIARAEADLVEANERLEKVAAEAIASVGELN